MLIEVMKMVEGKQKGRPTKYTEELAQQILDKIAGGLSRGRACEYYGLALSTIANWGKQHPDFLDSLTRAEIELELYLITSIRNSTSGKNAHDWKADAWLLARKFGNEYVTASKVEVSMKPPKPLSEMTDNELADYRNQVSR
jgi:hypothetical protein